MKVLHITNNYPTTANPVYGIFVKEQIDSLSKLGINNEVFFINGRENGKFEYIKSILRLRRHLAIYPYDIVHCHHALSGLCLLLSNKYKNSNSVLSYQNEPSREFGNFLYRIFKNVFKIIILKFQSTDVDGNKIYYQPNGVNIDLFQPRNKIESKRLLNLDPAKLYLLFVSSNFIRKQKRYDKFSQVLNILREKYSLIDIEELVLTKVPRDLVPLYFNAANLHILTSDFEGSPNSVKESLACNTPVVTTNVGDVRLTLKNTLGCAISQENNANEIAELAYKILSNKDAFSGRDDLIKKELDIQSVAKNIVKIYNSIIK